MLDSPGTLQRHSRSASVTVWSICRVPQDGRNEEFVDSSSQLIDHVDVALECEYLDNNYVESLTQEIKTAIRILNGYIKYLKGRKATK